MPPPPRPTPHERPQAKQARSVERERRRQDQVRLEITQLDAERHSIVNALKNLTAPRKQLAELLEQIETENRRSQTPNANLELIYRLREDIEQLDKQVKECQSRWEDVGEGIEEKHVELFFGVSDD